MLGVQRCGRPCIAYRPIRPSDLDILQQLHSHLFPIRYECDFFENVVNHRDIISWGAVDRSRPPSQTDQLIGFVTVKIVLAKDTEITDLLTSHSPTSNQTLLYILTLGVVEPYRNFGIASALIREVTNYARTLPTCSAVYLHVISYNTPAIYLYKKMSFNCIRRLYGFYFIDGHHYDAYLFLFYVNAAQSPCSPLELVVGVVNYLKTGFKSVTGKIWRYEERRGSRRSKCKESCGLITAQTKKNPSESAPEFQCV